MIPLDSGQENLIQYLYKGIGVTPAYGRRIGGGNMS